MSIQVGFIGTGLMGFPMAKNLLKSGYKLKIFSRTISKAEPLKEMGATISSSLNEVVTDQDLIITMLTDDKAVEKVLGDEEFINGLKVRSISGQDSSRLKIKTKKFN